MSPRILTLVIVGSMGASFGAWALVLWRDRRLARRRIDALRKVGHRPCERCDALGWLDCHRPAAEWRRCPRCHGWGHHAYLEAV